MYKENNFHLLTAGMNESENEDEKNEMNRTKKEMK